MCAPRPRGRCNRAKRDEASTVKETAYYVVLIDVCCAGKVKVWMSGEIGGYNSPRTDRRRGYVGALPGARALHFGSQVSQEGRAVCAKCVFGGSTRVYLFTHRILSKKTRQFELAHLGFVNAITSLLH